MLKLKANVVSEKVTAASRLSNFLPDFLVGRLAAAGFSLSSLAIKLTCDEGVVGSSVDDCNTTSDAVRFISLLRLLPYSFVVIFSMMSEQGLSPPFPTLMLPSVKSSWLKP
jgi:hypothetical protein